MSDETTSIPENSPDPVPRVRRISSPRPKKNAKVTAPEDATPSSAAEVREIDLAPEGGDDSETSPHTGADWPEPDAESTGGSLLQTESAKRKRRRRKGKGQPAGPQNVGGSPNDEAASLTVPEQKAGESSQENRPRQSAGPQHQLQRPKMDPGLLTKMAWKIYLAEVSEEGVALIGDNDAKDLSRRCFRLAEIFIEEQSRRR